MADSEANNIDSLTWAECHSLNERLKLRMRDLKMQELRRHAEKAAISDEEVAEVVASSYRCYSYQLEDLCKVELAMLAEMERMRSKGLARMWPLIGLDGSGETSEEFAQMFPELVR